jgi:predicted membrane chloride channel (bestrophin family)
MKKQLYIKWKILLQVIPIIAVILLIKTIFHHYGLEMMELNALFTSLVGATIFLIGFLISGVLSDYKESEKIPGEITTSLKNILDDSLTLKHHYSEDNFKQFIAFQKKLANNIKSWLYKEIETSELLTQFDVLNSIIIQLDKEGVQANFLIRIKNEISTVRKNLLRIEAIRETNFISSAYAIVESMAFVISAGLIFIKIEPFFAALFFTVLVTFLIIYMIILIKDLDDPFDYQANGESGTEISLDIFNKHLEYINANY